MTLRRWPYAICANLLSRTSFVRSSVRPCAPHGFPASLRTRHSQFVATPSSGPASRSISDRRSPQFQALLGFAQTVRECSSCLHRLPSSAEEPVPSLLFMQSRTSYFIVVVWNRTAIRKSLTRFAGISLGWRGFTRPRCRAKRRMVRMPVVASRSPAIDLTTRAPNSTPPENALSRSLRNHNH